MNLQRKIKAGQNKKTEKLATESLNQLNLPKPEPKIKFRKLMNFCRQSIKNFPFFGMVLRTSDKLRLSGFDPLAEPAEFVSVKKNLPEPEDSDIFQALRKYLGRQRRFGGRG